MAYDTSSVGSSAIPVVPQARYARLWKSVVSGVVPSRTDDVDAWYGVAQHLLGVALHEAQLDQVLDDVMNGDAHPKTQHAA